MIKSIWPYCPPPSKGLNPWPRSHGFHRLGRGLHWHHNHEFSSSPLLWKLRRFFKDYIHFQYIDIMAPPKGPTHCIQGGGGGMNFTHLVEGFMNVIIMRSVYHLTLLKKKGLVHIIVMHLFFIEFYLYVRGEEVCLRFNIFSLNGHIGLALGLEPLDQGPRFQRNSKNFAFMAYFAPPMWPRGGKVIIYNLDSYYPKDASN